MEQKRAQRSVLFMLIGQMAGLLPNLGSAADQPQGSRVDTDLAMEQFETFVSHPPVISNLLLQRKLIERNDRSFDGSFALSSTFAYYQAKWQPGAVFFRKLNNPSDVTNNILAGDFVSSFGETNWITEFKPVITTWSEQPGTNGKLRSVYYTRNLLLEPLREALNFGMMHLRIGSIRWTNHHFRVQSDADVDQWVVSGALSSTGGDRPDHLNAFYRLGTNVYHYVVRYGYQPPLKLSFIPTNITNFWVASNGKEVDIDEWRILDMDTSTEPLPGSGFEVERFLKASGWPIQIYKDNAYYNVLSNGTLHLLRSISSSSIQNSAHPGSLGKRFLYIVWLACNFAVFGLIARTRNMDNKTNS
jgi:hypothetical protein